MSWRSTPSDFGILLPYSWGMLAVRQAVNRYRVSYPGYSKIPTGRARRHDSTSRRSIA
jgi:hypothetical protein